MLRREFHRFLVAGLGAIKLLVCRVEIAQSKVRHEILRIEFRQLQEIFLG